MLAIHVDVLMDEVLIPNLQDLNQGILQHFQVGFHHHLLFVLQDRGQRQSFL